MILLKPFCSGQSKVPSLTIAIEFLSLGLSGVHNYPSFGVIYAESLVLPEVRMVKLESVMGSSGEQWTSFRWERRLGRGGKLNFKMTMMFGDLTFYRQW